MTPESTPCLATMMGQMRPLLPDTHTHTPKQVPVAADCSPEDWPFATATADPATWLPPRWAERPCMTPCQAYAFGTALRLAAQTAALARRTREQEAENERLRCEIERVRSSTMRVRREVARLEAENRGLRKGMSLGWWSSLML